MVNAKNISWLAGWIIAFIVSVLLLTQSAIVINWIILNKSLSNAPKSTKVSAKGFSIMSILLAIALICVLMIIFLCKFNLMGVNGDGFFCQGLAKKLSLNNDDD